MQIEQYSIEDLLNHINIVDIVSKVVKLKKSGNNYFACCPFHAEKTASFCINSKDQLYHCFGCSASGNVITFMMEHYGLDFVGAVEKLANEYNYRLEYKNKPQDVILSQKKQKLPLVALMLNITKFYQQNLEMSKIANDYLVKRNITKDSIKKFQLGYAPNHYNALKLLFADYKTNQNLIDVGVLVKNEHGDCYDRFRDRIIFPIHNLKGEVVAFGGRIISDDKNTPKYLNSPETVLFNKSQELYGIHQSYKSIKQQNSVIVVEGYIDVVILHQYGITNVVATMGTAINQNHIKILFRICDNIYFGFDGDNAGKNAAFKALEQVIHYITDIKSSKFIFLPNNHDPDSFIRMYGYDGFIKYVEEDCVTFSDYLYTKLAKEVNINTEEGRAKFISLIKPYLDIIKAPAMQIMLKAKLAQYVQLSPVLVDSILNNKTRYAFYNTKWQNAKEHHSKIKTPTPYIYDILNIINSVLNNIELLKTYKLPTKIDNFVDEIKELIFVLDYISHNYTKADNITWIDLINNTIAKDNYPLILAKIKQVPIVDLKIYDDTMLYDNLNKLLEVNSNRIKIPKIKMKE